MYYKYEDYLSFLTDQFNINFTWYTRIKDKNTRNL